MLPSRGMRKAASRSACDSAGAGGCANMPRTNCSTVALRFAAQPLPRKSDGFGAGRPPQIEFRPAQRQQALAAVAVHVMQCFEHAQGPRHQHDPLVSGEHLVQIVGTPVATV